MKFIFQRPNLVVVERLHVGNWTAEAVKSGNTDGIGLSC